MVIRKPKIVAPDLEQTQALLWHTLRCELVTPMYGGGVEAATIDNKMPIRVSAIRGQLRFWWRLLAQHQWQLGNTQAIRDAEFKLWGGTGKETTASLVFLKVSKVENLNVEPWARYEPHHKGGFKTIPTPENWANVPYVLFPAQGKKPGSPDSKMPSALIKAGLKWQLDLTFDKRTTDAQKDQVWQVMRWWASFGGLGARTRRGLGAVQVIGQHIAPVTEAEVQAAGCRLELKPQSNSAYTSWTQAVGKLQSFRQVNVGRASHSNRSRWPEPDAIRRLKNQNSPPHAPVHAAGNVFPRAAFGLPIIFKFKDDGNRPTDEPAQTSLQPIINGNVEERMASPIILRPYFNGQGWQSAALLLPHEHVDRLKLNLSGSEATYWNKEKAEHVTPICDHDANNPLDAFLNYFNK